MILRGLYLHIIRRKVDSIYIFDRYAAQLKQLSCDPPEAPDVRIWKEFLSLYTSSFERDTEAFYNACFQTRETHQHVSYTFADILFKISASRSELKKRLVNLFALGLLPPQNPHHRKSQFHQLFLRRLRQPVRPDRPDAPHFRPVVL